jgi:hypothetical protein
MANNLKQAPDGEYAWMRKVQRYIAYGQKGRALRLLEKNIEYDMPLFYGLSDVQEDRRLALVYLRHHGQMANIDYRRMNRIDALTAGQEHWGSFRLDLLSKEVRAGGRVTPLRPVRQPRERPGKSPAKMAPSRHQVLNPLLEGGLIEMTITDKPRSSRQKYRLTERGHRFLAERAGYPE